MLPGVYEPRSPAGTVLHRVVRTHLERFFAETAAASDGAGVPRFGSGLELNVHFHALGLDGVFAPGADGTLRFHRLPPPSDADVARLVATIARRVERLLVRRGLVDDADALDPLAAESLALAGLASAAVQGRDSSAHRCGRTLPA